MELLLLRNLRRALNIWIRSAKYSSNTFLTHHERWIQRTEEEGKWDGGGSGKFLCHLSRLVLAYTWDYGKVLSISRNITHGLTKEGYDD